MLFRSSSSRLFDAVIAISYPPAANSRAIARPMPREAPVINAVLCSIESGFLSKRLHNRKIIIFREGLCKGANRKEGRLPISCGFYPDFSEKKK